MLAVRPQEVERVRVVVLDGLRDVDDVDRLLVPVLLVKVALLFGQHGYGHDN